MNYEKELLLISFGRPYHDKYTRDQNWYSKQQWRRSLITTEM
jgi:hypothetical protein